GVLPGEIARARVEQHVADPLAQRDEGPVQVRLVSGLERARGDHGRPSSSRVVCQRARAPLERRRAARRQHEHEALVHGSSWSYRGACGLRAGPVSGQRKVSWGPVSTLVLPPEAIADAADRLDQPGVELVAELRDVRVDGAGGGGPLVTPDSVQQL